jgi:hypothetical protein
MNKAHCITDIARRLIEPDAEQIHLLFEFPDICIERSRQNFQIGCHYRLSK